MFMYSCLILCIFIVMFMYYCLMFMYFYCYICSVLCILFHCVILCSLCVKMCSVLLPPVVNLTVVKNMYIHIISCPSYSVLHM
jgi:hypothetical protein